MKLFSYLLLLFLALGCNSASVETLEEAIVEEESFEILEEVEIEIPVVTVDSTFELLIPNIDSIRVLHKKDDYRGTQAYIYLREYYGLDGEKTDLVFSEWDSTQYCSFVQKFHSEIVYQTAGCKEAGISETITFPKIETEKAREFINAMFSTEDNTWSSETSYDADGAGCYYTIIQEEAATKIEIWCGC